MLKKTMLLAMSVAALVAFAVPTVASAQLLTKNGTKVALGTELTSTSSYFRMDLESSLATECQPVTIRFEVTQNKTQSSEMVSKEMTSPFCYPIFKAMGPTGTIYIQFEGLNTGTSRTAFSVEENSAILCKYGNASPAPALAATHASNSPGFSLEGNVEGVGCGIAHIVGHFDLRATDGTYINIA